MTPELGSLGGSRRADDKPFQRAQLLRRRAAWPLGQKIGVPHEAPAHAAGGQGVPHQGKVGALAAFRQPAEAVVVLEGGRLAPPFLQGRHEGLDALGMGAVGLGMGLKPRLQRRRPFRGPGKGAGKARRIETGERRRGLARAAAHVRDTAAEHAEVSQEQLHHRGRTNRLGARRMLHETRTGKNLARRLRSARSGERLVNPFENRPVYPAQRAYGIQIITVVELLDLHPHARAVLQGDIAPRLRRRGKGPHRHVLVAHPGKLSPIAHVPRIGSLDLVAPRLLIVGAVHGVPPEEQARSPVVAERRAQQVGGVGEVQHVLGLPAILLDDVADETAEKRRVGTGAQRQVDVGHLRGAGAHRIHHNPGGTALLGSARPARRERLGGGMIGAYGEHDVGLGDGGPRSVGHIDAAGGPHALGENAPTEGDLAVEMHHAPAAQGLGNKVLLLDRQMRAAEAGNGLGAHNRHLPLLLHEGLVTRLLHQAGDLSQGIIPGNILPLIRSGAAYPGPRQTAGIGDRLAESIAPGLLQLGQRLGPQARLALGKRMVDIALHRRDGPLAQAEAQAAATGAALADDRLPRQLLLGLGRLLIGPRRRDARDASRSRRYRAGRSQKAPSR